MNPLLQAISLLAAMLLPVSADGAAENLIRNPGFESDADRDGKPDGWQTAEGSHLDAKVKHTGEVSLFVAGSALQVPIAVKPQTGYRWSVWVKRAEQGLTRLFVGDVVGNGIASTDNGGSGMSAWSGAFDWQRFELAFRSGEHSRISLYLIPMGSKEQAWFDDLELVEDDTVRVGDVSPVDHELPRLTPHERKRGYLLFSRHTLVRTFHTSVPRRDEIIDTLRVRAAPGEYESVVLGVRALRKLSRLCLSGSRLNGPRGACIDARNIELRVVRPSVRRFSGVSYVLLPLFLPRALPADLEADTTRVFWLTVHVPDRAPAGTYRATVMVRAEDAPAATVRLEMEVRPMQLLPAPIAFGVYYGLGRVPEPYRAKRYQRLYYEDMKAHGMTSVTTYNYPDLIAEHGQERVAFEQPPRDLRGALSLDEEMALIQETKLIGAHVPLLYLGNFQGPAERTRIQAIRQHQKERGWPEFLFYVSDEPGSPERLEAARKQLAAHAEVGNVRTVTAAVPIEELGRLYDVWIQSVGMDEGTRQKAAQWHKELWAYDCQLHGATPQHDRYLAGLYAWRWRLRGLFQWAYTHFADRLVTEGGEWKNTDDWQYGYVVPGPDGPIPTLGWEGRREGIDDYRYFHTLETLVKDVRAGSNARMRALADRAARFLDDLRARVRPNAYAKRPPGMNAYAVDFIPQPEIAPADYDRFREEAAGLIAPLREGFHSATKLRDSRK